MKTYKLIFIGTGAIGSRLLETVIVDDRFEVCLVVTGVDKPAGRKMELRASEIKKVAESHGIDVFQPENINDESSVNMLKSCVPDIALLMAYGQIVNQEVLDIPSVGFLNVHASLLPRYRGASPIQSSLLNQDAVTGISLMKMVAKMDAGPVYETFEQRIDDTDTASSLSDKLAVLSAEQIPDALERVASKNFSPTDQDDSAASYVTKITKADGQIDWSESSDVILAKIKAFDPWPGTYTFFGDKRLKVLSATVSDGSAKPGQVTEDGIGCGSGLLLPTQVQLEGKNRQNYADFINGNSDFIGSNLA